MSVLSIFTLTDWNPINTLYEEISIPPDPKDKRILLRKLRKSSQARFKNFQTRLLELYGVLAPTPAATKRDACLNQMMMERILFFHSYQMATNLKNRAIPVIPRNDSRLTQDKFVHLARSMAAAHSVLGMAENCMNEVEEILNKSRQLPT
jgi:hypothetical protein